MRKVRLLEADDYQLQMDDGTPYDSGQLTDLQARSDVVQKVDKRNNAQTTIKKSEEKEDEPTLGNIENKWNQALKASDLINVFRYEQEYLSLSGLMSKEDASFFMQYNREKANVAFQEYGGLNNKNTFIKYLNKYKEQNSNLDPFTKSDEAFSLVFDASRAGLLKNKQIDFTCEEEAFPSILLNQSLYSLDYKHMVWMLQTWEWVRTGNLNNYIINKYVKLLFASNQMGNAVKKISESLLLEAPQKTDPYVEFKELANKLKYLNANLEVNFQTKDNIIKMRKVLFFTKILQDYIEKVKPLSSQLTSIDLAWNNLKNSRDQGLDMTKQEKELSSKISNFESQFVSLFNEFKNKVSANYNTSSPLLSPTEVADNIKVLRKDVVMSPRNVVGGKGQSSDYGDSSKSSQNTFNTNTSSTRRAVRMSDLERIEAKQLAQQLSQSLKARNPKELVRKLSNVVDVLSNPYGV